MDTTAAMQTIRRLCSFEGRHAGSDAERRAASDLAAQLEQAGRRAELEPTYVHPQWTLVHAAHAAIAVAGSLVSIASPPLGFGLVLVAAASTYLDLNTRFYLLRRAFFRRASQNVLARGRRGGAPARVVLCAHYDAARTGFVYGERSVRLAARLSPRLRVALGPFRLIFWSMALLVPVLGTRMAGVDAQWLAVIQLLPTVLLILAAVALIDIALSDVVPGAGDNASGVAVTLALAATLDREPLPHLDVWVLLSGAEECLGEGTRGFVKSHRRELERDSTYFLILDTVGCGRVHYVTSEGLAIGYAMDPRLVALCEAIATADREGENRFEAAPVASPLLTDATPARLAGYPAIVLTTLDERGLPAPTYHTPQDTPERIEERSLADAHDFALSLIRQIDADVGRRHSRPVV